MKLEEFYSLHQREILLAVMILLFIVPYMLINHLSVGKEKGVLLSRWDALFPFLPFMVLLYISCYLLVIMPYFFVKEKEENSRLIVRLMKGGRFAVEELDEPMRQRLLWLMNAELNPVPSSMHNSSN